VKLIFTIRILFLSTLIFSTVCIHSMKSNSQGPLPKSVIFIPKQKPAKRPISLQEYQEYKQRASQAAAYNHNNQLLQMPNEILTYIFLHCHTDADNQVNSLKKNIKFFMELNNTCTFFNEFLTFDTIGKLCKHYTALDKTETLKQLMKGMTGFNYKNKRLPALILVCAGADTATDIHHEFWWDQKVILKSDFLLQKAVFRNDIHMITTLFEHHAPVDVTLRALGPLFFQIKTAEIAQIFINQRVHAHIANSSLKAKIFQQIVEDDHPSELLAVYFEHNPDAIKLNFGKKSCLLHVFARPSTLSIHTIEKFLKKGALIVNAMPDMINAVNENEHTPLDIAKQSLLDAEDHGTPEAFEKLIVLLRNSGAKTAQELKEEAYANSIICMDTCETVLEVPHINNHEQNYLCLSCYSTLLTTSDECPLCRYSLKK
jgi:hypothetical protein